MSLPYKLRVVLIVAIALAGIIYIISKFNAPTREPFEDVNPMGDFFMRISKPDLYARNLGNMKYTSDYREFYFGNTSDPSPEQTSILKVFCYKADDLIKDSGFSALLDIPWNFKMINDNIENGFPHTIKDVIYLPKKLLDRINNSRNEDIIQTLIHERIHLFQRAHPNETEILIGLWGFVGSPYVDELQRNNPDLNGINYSYQGSVILQKYNSPKPSSLMDSAVVAMNKDKDFESPIKSATVLGFPNVVKQFEHPYEIMADLLAYIIVHLETLDENIKNNNKVLILYDWLRSLKPSQTIIHSNFHCV